MKNFFKTFLINKFQLLLKILFSCFLFLLISGNAFAQINVRGSVHDAKGEPLVGVNVIIVKSNKGVVTNTKGEFDINVSEENAEIEFSYVGFKTKKISLDGRTLLNIVMLEDNKLLDEYVVVGYGTQKKESVTGSVAQIASKDIAKMPVGSISNALVGKLPGLVTRQSTGVPGSDGAAIRVRGFSTYGDSSPIIIVDGVQRSLNEYDPNEIESISILKDASAAAVYGVQGAGGVILVTTKRGKNQKAKITYSGEVAYNQNTDYPEYLDGPDFVKYYNKALEMDGLEPKFTKDVYDKLVNGDPEGRLANTNWFNEIMKKGTMSTHHNISVNGGNGSANYFISLGYLYKDGIIDKIDFNRYNVRSNLDVKLDKGLKLIIDLAARQEERNSGYFSIANQYWNNPINMAALTLPIVPKTYKGLPASASISNDPYNPVAYNNDAGYINTVKNVLQTSLALSWDVPWVKGLNAKIRYNYDKSYTTFKAWVEPFKLNFYDIKNDKYIVKSAIIGEPVTQRLKNHIGQYEQTSIQGSINYNRTFGDHEFSGLVVYEQTETEGQELQAIVQDFDLTTLHEINRANKLLGGKDAEVGKAVSGGSSVFSRAGFVGRLNYNYKQKYLLELSARYDGSVRFPKKNRWGLFPAFSAGWRISEEQFFKDLNTPIEYLKFRASYGLLGNDRVGYYPYLNFLNPNPPTVYFGNKEYISVYTSAAANKDITWEKTATYNVGFDMTFNKGIFGMEFDYFYKYTTDILMPGGTLYPGSLGGNVPGMINGGRMENKGLELVLSHKKTIGEITYSVRGNMSWSRNKILKRRERPNIPNYQKRTGHKLGQRLGFKTLGLFQTEEEIYNSPTLSHLSKKDIRPGDLKYVDINNDGKIKSNQDYVVIADSSFPELMYGFNIGANWRNFDISIFFQGATLTDMLLSGVYGNGNVDGTLNTRPFYGNGNSPRFLIENSWMKEGDQSEFTRLTTIGDKANPNGWASDWWVRDASYLRLKNVQISYTLSKAAAQRLGVSNLRLSITGSNLLTWSGLKKYNIDPEAPDITNGYYPQQRTFQFGISLTL